MVAPVGILLFGIGVVVVLVIGATLFRAAVAAANKTIGPVKPNASLAWDWEAADDDEDYEQINSKLQAIPEPGLGQGMLIMLAVGVVQLVLGVLLDGALNLDRARRRGDVEEWLPVHLFALVIGFAVMTGLVSSMLPTSGRRAALATFFFYLITIAIAGFIVGVLFVAFRSM